MHHPHGCDNDFDGGKVNVRRGVPRNPFLSPCFIIFEKKLVGKNGRIKKAHILDRILISVYYITSSTTMKTQ